MTIKPGDQVIVSTNITNQTAPIEGKILRKKTRVKYSFSSHKFENIPTFEIDCIDGCKYTATIDDITIIDQENKTA